MPSKHKLIPLSILSLLMYSMAACAVQEDAQEQILPLLPPSLCPVYDYELITIDNPLPLGVARQLVGLTENKASLCAASLNWPYRVGVRDNEYFALTADYAYSRVTVVVKEGIVTSVDVG